MINKTYNEIIRYLRIFAEEHADVQRFEEEDEDQMSALTSMEEKFPMMFITPISNLFDYDLNNYRLRIYCYDRLTKDRENNTNIRSKTNQILNDLDVWLRKEPTLPFEIDTSTSAQPFSSELMTDVTGWYIEVQIDNPSFSVCDIPFNNIPQLPLGPCEEDGHTPPDFSSFSRVYNDNYNPTYIEKVMCGDRLYLPKEDITVNGELLVTKNSVEDFNLVIKNNDGNLVAFNIVNGEIIIDCNTDTECLFKEGLFGNGLFGCSSDTEEILFDEGIFNEGLFE